jgi:DNA modification methylase
MALLNLIGKPLHMNCFDLLAILPDECVDLLFLDPPYNIGVFCKVSPGEYLDWCGRWIAEGSRVLKPNGAFWLCHKDPGVLVDLSRMIAEYGRKRVNWVTWDKLNGNPAIQATGGPLVGMTQVKSLRSFQAMAEYFVYHVDMKCIARVIREARLAAKAKRTDIDIALGYVRTKNPTRGTELCRRWEEASSIPSKTDFVRCMNFLSRNEVSWDSVYEDLRYTFNNPGKVSSVWQIPPALSNGHPTPKPEALLERVIEATSNPDDLVLDFFAGSFTTAVVAERLGRRWICCDSDEKWIELGQKRLQEAQQLEMVWKS